MYKGMHQSLFALCNNNFFLIGFYFSHQVIIETTNKNYSLSNLKDFFLDISYPDAINISRQVPPIWINDPPNVPLYCLYGTNVPTPETFKYGLNKFPDSFPKTSFGDGDGTVNIRSLKACERFINKQQQKVVVESFRLAGHTEIISDPRVIKYIAGLLLSLN